MGVQNLIGDVDFLHVRNQAGVAFAVAYATPNGTRVGCVRTCVRGKVVARERERERERAKLLPSFLRLTQVVS